MNAHDIILLYLFVCTTMFSKEVTASIFYIGGLFPSTETALGAYPEIAAKIALRRINQRGLLAAHNVSLEMVSASTDCTSSGSVYAYLNLVQRFEKSVGSTVSGI